MGIAVIERKMDEQGRIRLPKDIEGREVYIIKEKGIMKIIPKRDVKFSDFFDKAKPSEITPDPFEDYKKCLSKRKT